jgi:hypothetical protein
MYRAPRILKQLDAEADKEQLTQLYDEADEWKDALVAYTESSPGDELTALAKAVATAVSVAMGMTVGKRGESVYFQEKVGEANAKWLVVNSRFYGYNWDEPPG